MKKTIRIMSCGYKHGVPPADAAFVLDCRSFKNPFYEPHLKHLTGADEPVQQFLENEESVQLMLSALPAVLKALLPGHLAAKSYHPEEVKLVFACTGGKHRSRFFALKAQAIVSGLIKQNPQWNCHVVVSHRDLGRD